MLDPSEMFQDAAADDGIEIFEVPPVGSPMAAAGGPTVGAIDFAGYLKTVLVRTGLWKSANVPKLRAVLLSATPDTATSGYLQILIDAVKEIWADPHTQAIASQVFQAILAMILANFGPARPFLGTETKAPKAPK